MSDRRRKYSIENLQKIASATSPSAARALAKETGIEPQAITMIYGKRNKQYKKYNSNYVAPVKNEVSIVTVKKKRDHSTVGQPLMMNLVPLLEADQLSIEGVVIGFPSRSVTLNGVDLKW